MTISVFASGTLSSTAGGTEDFLQTGGGVSPNEIGEFCVIVDLNAMAANDVVEMAEYKMALTGGTSRKIKPPVTFQGARSVADVLVYISDWIPNDLTDTNAVRFSLKQTAGSSRSFPWKILKRDDALKPTVAGRTLDISSTGEAGIDLANVGSPTTTLNLSGTTIKTATDVETDTANIQTRIPAALISGRIDSTVGEMQSNVLTAGALDTTAVTELVDAIAAAVATIADIWDYPTLSIATAGSIGKLILDMLNATVSSRASQTSVDSVQADTDNIQTRLPAALVSGRMDSNVQAMGTDVVNSTALSTTAVNEIVDAVLAAFAATNGTASAGAAGSITLVSPAVATTDYYINHRVYIRSGTGAGQSRRIKSYTSGRVATVDGNWATTPDNTSVYYVFPGDRVDIGTILGTTINALISGRVDVSVGAYQTGLTPLQPTVSGRTLDVSAGGEAGVDWANVGSPTTVLALTGTTVKTATDVETDTQDIQTRLPAALIGGRMNSDVEAINNNTNVIAAFVAALGIQTVGTVVTGTLSTTAFSTNLTTPNADAWRRHTIAFISGNLSKFPRGITAYAVTNGVITVDEALPVAPANGDQFVII